MVERNSCSSLRVLINNTTEMQNWSDEILEPIEEQLKDVKEKDLRFFRVDEFKRNIRRTGENMNSCPVCNKNRIPITEVCQTLLQAIQVPGKSRREYDRLISNLSRHMRKEHNFYPPYHYTYLYSFFGILAGLTAGFLLSLLFPSLVLEMFSLGFSLGIIPGYIWGSIKDNKIRKEKRLM